MFPNYVSVQLNEEPVYILLWRCSPTRAMAPHSHTQRRITVGRTPLDE